MANKTMHAAGSPRKDRVPELEMLRGVAILAVIMVHATSRAVVSVHDSAFASVYIFLNTFSLFCVPAFIFLSGFVLFYNYFDRPLTLGTLKSFYGKRLKQLIVPYLFISLGYELVGQVQRKHAWDLSLLKSFGEHLLTGKSYTHLYYIFITIQLYLLFPLLLLLFQKLRMSVRLAIPLGFAVQWAFYLLNREYWHIAAKGSWSPTYFAAFLLGAYLGMRPNVLKRLFIDGRGERKTWQSAVSGLIWLLWLAATAAFIWMYYELRTGGSTPKGYWYEIGYNLFTVLTAVVLLKACMWLRRRNALRSLSAVLSDLGALSFGIYLIHPLFLLVYRLYQPASGTPLVYHSWTAGGYVFALGASLIVLLAAFRFIPWSWIVLGPAPAKFQPVRKAAKTSAVDVSSSG